MLDIFGFTAELGERVMRNLGISLTLWIIVMAAILLDLWDRCYTNRLLKKPLKSHKLRLTFAKFSEYWRYLLLAMFVDLIGSTLTYGIFTWYEMPFISMLTSIGLVTIEFFSMREHARERKSNLTQLDEILKMTISCATEADAKNALKKFKEYLLNEQERSTK